MIVNKQNFRFLIAACLALGITAVGTKPAISGSPPYGSGQQIKESHVNPMAKASKAAGKSKKTAQTVTHSSNKHSANNGASYQNKKPQAPNIPLPVMPLHTQPK